MLGKTSLVLSLLAASASSVEAFWRLQVFLLRSASAYCRTDCHRSIQTVREYSRDGESGFDRFTLQSFVRSVVLSLPPMSFHVLLCPLTSFRRYAEVTSIQS